MTAQLKSLVHKHHGVTISATDAAMTVSMDPKGLLLAALLVLVGKGH